MFTEHQLKSKKLVLALEGGDGSGKTTACQILEKLCTQFHVPFACIGRNQPLEYKHIYSFTNLLKQHGNMLSNECEFFVRTGREFQRAFEAAKIPQGVIVLDRFVLSVYARYDFLGNIKFPYDAILNQATEIAGLGLTIFLDCPFELAWNRRQRKALVDKENLSAKELKGFDYNKEFLFHHRKALDKAALTKELIIIKNCKTVADLENDLVQIFNLILVRLGIN